jgi:hypothetical protein
MKLVEVISTPGQSRARGFLMPDSFVVAGGVEESTLDPGKIYGVDQEFCRLGKALT